MGWRSGFEKGHPEGRSSGPVLVPAPPQLKVSGKQPAFHRCAWYTLQGRELSRSSSQSRHSVNVCSVHQPDSFHLRIIYRPSQVHQQQLRAAGQPLDLVYRVWIKAGIRFSVSCSIMEGGGPPQRSCEDGLSSSRYTEEEPLIRCL